MQVTIPIQKAVTEKITQLLSQKFRNFLALMETFFNPNYSLTESHLIFRNIHNRRTADLGSAILYLPNPKPWPARTKS